MEFFRRESSGDNSIRGRVSKVNLRRFGSLPRRKKKMGTLTDLYSN